MIFAPFASFYNSLFCHNIPRARVRNRNFDLFAFTTFTEGEKKDGKRGGNEGKLTVAMLDKNRVKILDNIEIVKNCPKYLR